MTRLDRLERAIQAFIDRVELDCKTNSPGHRSVDEVLALHHANCPPFQAQTGMEHVTFTILHGIVDMRDVLNDRGNPPRRRHRSHSGDCH